MSLSRPLPPSSMLTRSRKRKLEEEYRNILPILNFPNEIIFEIYPYLDLATRRALRFCGRLAEIEKEVKYRFYGLAIYEEATGVRLAFHGQNLAVPRHDVSIARAELEKELELMKRNSQFVTVKYENRLLLNRFVDIMGLIESRRITITEQNLKDDDLQSIVQNRQQVSIIEYRSAVTANGIGWVYERMRDGQLDLEYFVILVRSVTELWLFLERLGSFNRQTRVFTKTNPKHTVCARDTNKVAIFEGRLKIMIQGIELKNNGQRLSMDIKQESARFVCITRGYWSGK